MDYHSMKRKDLQVLCKKHNLRANGTNLEMADRLASLLKKPVSEAKKALKSLDGSDENGSKVVKKVTFSEEQDQVKMYHVDDDNSRQTRSRRESVALPKTRSRKGKEVVGLLESPVEIKRPRKGEKKGSDQITKIPLSDDNIGASVGARSTRRQSLGGGVDVKVVEVISPVKTRRGKASREVEPVAIVEVGVKQTRSSKKVVQDDAEMPKEETKIGETTRGRVTRKNEGETESAAPVVVEEGGKQTRSRKKGVQDDAEMAKEESKIVEERGVKTRRGQSSNQNNEGDQNESAPVAAEEGGRKTRSRRSVEEYRVKGVSSLGDDAQVAENAQKLEEMGSKRSKKSQCIQKTELSTKRSKRTGTGGNAIQSLERELGNASKPEPAPRRTRRTATTTEKPVISVAEEPPRRTLKPKTSAQSNVVAEQASKGVEVDTVEAPRRTRRTATTIEKPVTEDEAPSQSNTAVEEPIYLKRNLKRKSIAPVNVVAEQPSKRRRQTTTHSVGVHNVEAKKGGGGRNAKAEKLQGKIEVLVDIASKRDTKSASRHESDTVESGDAVPMGDASPSLGVKEKALKQKGGLVKSKTGAKKSSVKGRRGKSTSKGDDDQAVEVSAQGMIEMSDENFEVPATEALAITGETCVHSEGETNVTLSTGDHAISEEPEEEQFNRNFGGLEPVSEQIEEDGHTDSQIRGDFPAPNDILLCNSDVKKGQQSSAKPIIRNNEYKTTAEANAYGFSAEASTKEVCIESVGAYQEEDDLGKTPLSSKHVDIEDGVEVSQLEDGNTAQKEILLTEGLDKSNSCFDKSSRKLKQSMSKGSEQKTDSKKVFEEFQQQSSESVDIRGLPLETVVPADVKDSPVSVGHQVFVEKGNSPLDHSLFASEKSNTSYRSKNDGDDMGAVSPFMEGAYRNNEDGQTDSSVDSGYSTRAMKGFSDSSISNKSSKAVEAKEMSVGALEYSAEASSSKGKNVQSVRGDGELNEEFQSSTQFKETVDYQFGTEVVGDERSPTSEGDRELIEVFQLSTQLENLEETVDYQVGTEVVEDEGLPTSQEIEDLENLDATEHNSRFEDSLDLFKGKDDELPHSSEGLHELKKSDLVEVQGHNILQTHQAFEGNTVEAENDKNGSPQSHTSSPNYVQEEFLPALSNKEEAETVPEVYPECDVDPVDKEESEYTQQISEEASELEKNRVQGVYDIYFLNERSRRESIHKSQASISTEDAQNKEHIGATEQRSDFDSSLGFFEDKDAVLPQSSEAVHELKKSDPMEMHANSDVKSDQSLERDTAHFSQLSGEFVGEKHENVSVHSHSMLQSPRSSERLLALNKSDPLKTHGNSDAESDQHSQEDTTFSNQLSGEYVSENNKNVPPHTNSMFQSTQSPERFFEQEESDALGMHNHSDIELDQHSEGDTTHSNQLAGEFAAEINNNLSRHWQTSNQSNVTEKEFFTCSSNMKEGEKVAELESGVRSVEEDGAISHPIHEQSVDLENITVQGIYKSFESESDRNMSTEQKTKHDDLHNNSEISSKMSHFEGVEMKGNASGLVEEFDKEQAGETTTLMFQVTQGSPLAQRPTQSAKETEMNVATIGYARDFNNSDLLKEHGSESLQDVYERISKLKNSCFEDISSHANCENKQPFAKEEACVERGFDFIGSTSVAENEKSSEPSLFSQTSTPITLEDTEVTSTPTCLEEDEMDAELEANWGSENDSDFDEESRDAHSSAHSAEIINVLCALEQNRVEQSETVIETSEGKKGEGVNSVISEYTDGISQEAVREPPKQEQFSMQGGGEEDGHSVSVLDYPVSGFSENEAEHIIEAFPKTIIDSSLRCLIFHHESVTRCQGNEESKNGTLGNHLQTCDVVLSSGDMEKEKAAFVPNKSYEKSMKRQELSEFVSEVQFEDAGNKLQDMADSLNLGASIPQHTPWKIGLFSGDDAENEKAAFTCSRSYGKSYTGRELSDSVPEMQVEIIGKETEVLDDCRSVGASTPHLTPRVTGLFYEDNMGIHNAASAPELKIEDAGNKSENMDDTENQCASTPHHDKEHGMLSKLALSEEGSSHYGRGVHTEDEKENTGSALGNLFAAEETEVAGLTLEKYHTDERMEPLEEIDMDRAMRMHFADAEASASVHGTPPGSSGAGIDQTDSADLDANVQRTLESMDQTNMYGSTEVAGSTLGKDNTDENMDLLEEDDLDSDMRMLSADVEVSASLHGTPPGSTMKDGAGKDQTDAANLDANVQRTPESMDAVNGLLTNMYITTAVKEKRFRLGTMTPAKFAGSRLQQPGVLASGMKENATNSKLDQSNRKVEKSAIKRRALGELPNSTAR